VCVFDVTADLSRSTLQLLDLRRARRAVGTHSGYSYRLESFGGGAEALVDCSSTRG